MFTGKQIVIIASVTITTLLAVVANCETANTASRADPGSFLIYKVNSVDSFVLQIATDKKVAARYAKHYGVSPEKLETYFQENLRIMTLDKPYRTTVYFMSKGNIIKQKQHVLKAGSRVFVGPDGLPLLEWRCGNPLGKKLPVGSKSLVKKSSSPAQNWAVAPAPTLEISASAAEVLPQAVPLVAIPTLVVQDAVPPMIGGFAMSPPLMLLGGTLPALVGGVTVSHRTDASSLPETPSLITLMIGIFGTLLYLRRLSRISLT